MNSFDEIMTKAEEILSLIDKEIENEKIKKKQGLYFMRNIVKLLTELTATELTNEIDE